MKTSMRTVEVRTFTSDVLPRITSEHPADESLIAWADARPVVWRIVMTKRSKVFGVGSCEHMGWAQKGTSSDAVLERVRTVRRDLEPDEHALARELGKEHLGGVESFWQWRARRTLELFDRPGFTGAMFREFAPHTDGQVYARGCAVLDYTPDALEEAVDRFVRWCSASPFPYSNRCRIEVGGRTVRTFPSEERT